MVQGSEIPAVNEQGVRRLMQWKSQMKLSLYGGV